MLCVCQQAVKKRGLCQPPPRARQTSTDYISQVGLLFCILYCGEAYTIFRTGAPDLRKCHKSLSDANTIDTMAMLEELIGGNASRVTRTSMLNAAFGRLRSLLGTILEAQQSEQGGGRTRRSEWVWIANFIYFSAFGTHDHPADDGDVVIFVAKLVRALLKVRMTVDGNNGGTVLSDKKRVIRMELFGGAMLEHYAHDAPIPQLELTAT